jgi:transcriptional regulator with XRE-family HTH domain
MMAKGPQSACDGQQPHPFATLLNQLFATRLSPEGRPYTLTEVSQATGISVPYLSYVRKGTIGAVPVHRAAPLARFFGVPLDYFSQEESPTEMLDDDVREALAQPLVRELVLRVGHLSLAQRALVLEILEHLDHLRVEPAQGSPSCPNHV